MIDPGVAVVAPAKVNLALHVVGRRADSYHLLDSIAAFADLGDRIAVTPAERLELSVRGPFAADAPGDRTDLAWRAADLFFAHTGQAARACIVVEKNIPAGAGLGGGSADAAAVLKALNRINGDILAADELAALGLELGADVPMCLAGRALRARGIGEQIESLKHWPPLPLVLVWPGSAVSTAAVFAALANRENAPLPEPRLVQTRKEATAWLAGCRNDLETPALRIATGIGETLAALRAASGCLLTRMSGSGSACYGIFESMAAAKQVVAMLRSEHPSWWVAATKAR
jgi:4-diphosphocytidyl-2-C-methyl-D-erythritol kinase